MTTLDRRRFLGLGASAAGALALGSAARSFRLGAPAPVLARAAVPEGNDLAAWTSAVGSRFSVTDATGHRATVTLQPIEPLAADPLLSGSGYAALFSGPLNPVLAPTVSSFEHPRVGPFAGVLLAVDQPVSQQLYQLILDSRRPIDPRR